MDLNHKSFASNDLRRIEMVDAPWASGAPFAITLRPPAFHRLFRDTLRERRHLTEIFTAQSVRAEAVVERPPIEPRVLGRLARIAAVLL